MNKTYYLFLKLLILLFISQIALSQNKSTLRNKSIFIQNDTIKLDSIAITIGSLQILDSNNVLIPLDSFKIDYFNSNIVINKRYNNQLLKFKYRTYSFDLTLHQKNRNKIHNYNTISESKILQSQQNSTTNKNENSIWEDLSKEGSITRGISIGNNSDVIVNSSLMLELSGKISENWMIKSVISDQNVPFQPEGNTQQLQEFDNVYIQLFDKHNKITAGDFSSNINNNYFLKFDKKLLGIDYQLDTKTKNDITIKTNTKLAFSKGKYAKNTLIPQDGNQGPYKLLGNNNETFILILSGSEKVYIDGKLLTRGFDNDYIIDYNTAEISFMPRNIITKEKRIIVEFEYSDKNYATNFVFGSQTFSNKYISFNIEALSEQDNKNKPINSNYQKDEINWLSEIGDNTENKLIDLSDNVEFNLQEILYSKIDSAGIIFYKHTTDNDSALYRVSFTFVGKGNGNYSLKKSNINGRIFEYIPPINEIKQGDYEAGMILVAPKQKQYVSGNLTINTSKRSRISIDYSLSNNDNNLYSKINDTDNKGFAIKPSFKSTFKLSEKWNLQFIISNEYRDKNYLDYEPIRNIEFNRDWSLQNTMKSSENILGSNIIIENPSKQKLLLDYQNYSKEKNYKANKLSIHQNLNLKKINSSLQTGIMQGSMLENTENIRYFLFLNITTPIKKIILGVKPSYEMNKSSNIISKKYIGSNYQYLEQNYYINSLDSSKNNWKLSYTFRDDYTNDSLSFFKNFNNHTIQGEYNLKKLKNQSLNLISNYRNKYYYKNSLNANNSSEDLLAFRINHDIEILKKSIQFSSFIDVSTGYEQKKDYYYIEVPVGRGNFAWLDYNSNGIKELNEFELTSFADKANYIKIYRLTNELEQIKQNEWTHILKYKLKPLIKSQKPLMVMLSKFSGFSQIGFKSKNKSENYIKAFIPEQLNINDSLLLNYTKTFKNSFFYDRYSSSFSVEISLVNQQNKTFYLQGTDKNDLNKYLLSIKKSINKDWTIVNKTNFNNSSYFSEYLEDKNYSIAQISNNINFYFQPNSNYRIGLNYTYTEKQSKYEKLLNPNAFINKIGCEFSFSQTSKASLNAKFDYLHIKYSSNINNSLAYEILEGFSNGENFYWNINYQRNLLKYLQLQINYDARKTAQNKIIHFGTIQLRAIF